MDAQTAVDGWVGRLRMAKEEKHLASNSGSMSSPMARHGRKTVTAYLLLFFLFVVGEGALLYITRSNMN